MAIRVQEAASLRFGEIYRYISDLFAALNRIERHGGASRPIPAEFGGEEFCFRHAHHFVYWRRLSNGAVGIVTIVQERMHQTDRSGMILTAEEPGSGAVAY